MPRPDSKPVYLNVDNFAVNLPVFHGFFTRKGGVSDGIYASLNCGVGSKDAAENVRQNKALIAKEAGCAPENHVNLYQVHGDTCLYVVEPWNEERRPEADAFVTDKPGLALGILTADCTPVLFVGKKADGSPVVGAAHAGWKGAVAGILSSTVEKMIEVGASIESIEAAIGPTIGKKSYEVTEDFTKAFLIQDDQNEQFFMPSRKEGHLMFDLPGYCASRLALAGVKQVNILDRDTYSDEEHFFSYRRKTHRDEPDYGRQVSAIMICDV